MGGMRGRVPGGPGQDRKTRRDWWGVVLDAPEALPLAQFYADLFGWRLDASDPGFVTLDPDEGVAYLAVQTSAGYQPPTWPNVPGRQQMQVHLDIEVSDLSTSVAAAVALGARVAADQPQHDVRVLLDPAGHPFCLYCPGWPALDGPADPPR